MKFNIQVFATCYLSFVLVLTLCSCEGKKGKTPVIYITDLYHPFNDPDDHFDLVALYAIKDFDIKGIIIDYANNSKIPGKIPIEQLNSLTGRDVPYYYGLKNRLITPEDKAEDQSWYQDGCKAIVNILKKSDRKVTIISVGSLRDVTAAYNRNPDLFVRKVERLVIFAGEATNKEFYEYNVDLDKNAFIRVINNIPNIYWVPCFDGGLWKNGGRASFWQDRHSVLLKGASGPVTNFFLYALSQSTDSIGFIPYLYKPVDQNDLHKYILDSTIPLRNLWCCSVFPYFAAKEKLDFPFSFENVRVSVDSNTVLHYSDSGNQVMRFRIQDTTNYGARMTTIYNSLTKEF